MPQLHKHFYVSGNTWNMLNEKKLDELLKQIIDIERLLLDCASNIIKAGQSKADNLDFIALSVINRAISLNKGYKTLIEANNTLSAVNLLRLQLDNLIRYNSIFVANEIGYIDYIIEGKPINKYKKGTQPFTDNYLAKELDKKFSNSLNLYIHLCEFIHYGKKHISKIITDSENKNALFRVVVGDNDNFTDAEKIDYTENLLSISINLLSLIRVWPEEKELYFN
jgi:hypothetical protein